MLEKLERRPKKLKEWNFAQALKTNWNPNHKVLCLVLFLLISILAVVLTNYKV